MEKHLGKYHIEITANDWLNVVWQRGRFYGRRVV